MPLAIQQNYDLHASYQKSFLWECEIQEVSSGVLDLLFDMRVINLLIDKITYPFVTIETEGWYKGATREYHPLINDVGDVVLTMKETEDGDVKSFLNAWQNLQRNSDGTYNYPSVYKKVVYVKQLKGNKEVVNKWKLGGTFIKGIEDISLSYEESTIFALVVTLSCDTVVVN
jgi:hypothetical protein